MTTNRELFHRDPTTRTLANDGVARVSAVIDPDVAKEELEMFVCEGHYELGLTQILQTYLNNMEKSVQPSAWVSGFFGSGKSHLVKVLRYLWTNEVIASGKGPASCATCRRQSPIAAAMLPQIFRPGDPALAVQLAPEHHAELEKLVEAIPTLTFTADDALGWVYQFWQSAEKDRVNSRAKAGEKITGETLPAVTQLFTEPYMVQFLLHNTLGAWHMNRVSKTAWPTAAAAAFTDESQLQAASVVQGYALDHLRWVKDDPARPWRTAAGGFEGWPAHPRDFKVLDPCCGSGHFLVSAFDLLVHLRLAHAEGDEQRWHHGGKKEVAAAVLRDNLFGLELDPRCTQIAAFNLAMAAWRFAGEYFELPEMHIACSGVGPSATLDQWLTLAGNDARAWQGIPAHARKAVSNGLTNLHRLFSQAPELGSLIDPSQLGAGGELFSADWETMQPFLKAALAQEKDADAHERAIAAQGMAKAAEVLSGEYTLVITNVPYLGRGGQGEVLKGFCEKEYPQAKADLATVFVSRMLKWLPASAVAGSGGGAGGAGTIAAVTPQNWLFLTSYKKLRERLLKERTWDMVARLGEHAFESSAAAGAFGAMMILSGGKPAKEPPHIMAGIDVSAPRGQRPIYAAEKAALLRGDLSLTPQRAESAVVGMASASLQPDGNAFQADGSAFRAGGNVLQPGGNTLPATGNTLQAGGSMFQTDGSMFQADGNTAARPHGAPARGHGGPDAAHGAPARGHGGPGTAHGGEDAAHSAPPRSGLGQSGMGEGQSGMGEGQSGAGQGRAAAAGAAALSVQGDALVAAGPAGATDPARTDADEEPAPDEAPSTAPPDGAIKLVPQAEQLKNPDARISFALGSQFDLLAAFAGSFVGLQNNDSPKNLAQFWELPHTGDRWDLFQLTIEDTIEFGGRLGVVRWPAEPEYLVKGTEAWGKRGVLIRHMGHLPATLYDGDRYDQSSAAIIPTDECNLPALWCFCSSPDFATAIRRIDQSLKVTNASLVKVPFDLAHWQRVAAEKYPNGLPEPQSDDPTQWLFHGHPAGTVPLSGSGVPPLSSGASNKRQDAASTRRLSELTTEAEDDKRQDAASTFFDPKAPTEFLSGNLPHWRQDGVTYFVTWRTADSLPQEKLDQWKRDRAAWLTRNGGEPKTPAQAREYARLFSDTIEDWLDAGYGACVFKRTELRSIVENALSHFDGQRYVLNGFVVAANHVHLLVTPREGHALSEIMHSWRSFTAKEINKALGTTGEFWQKESFDHIVRSPERLEKFRNYIRAHDVEAASSRLPAAAFTYQAKDKDKRQDAASTATILQVAVARLIGYRWPAELDTKMRLAPEARAWVEKCKALAPFADDDGVVPLHATTREGSAADRLAALLAAAFEGQRLDTQALIQAAGSKAATLAQWLRDDFANQHKASVARMFVNNANGQRGLVLAVEKGASTLLMPVSARKQLFGLSDDMATKIDIQFYADPREALLKALVE